jgi:hypothetical protein
MTEQMGTESIAIPEGQSTKATGTTIIKKEKDMKSGLKDQSIKDHIK